VYAGRLNATTLKANNHLAWLAINDPASRDMMMPMNAHTSAFFSAASLRRSPFPALAAALSPPAPMAAAPPTPAAMAAPTPVPATAAAPATPAPAAAAFCTLSCSS